MKNSMKNDLDSKLNTNNNHALNKYNFFDDDDDDDESSKKLIRINFKAKLVATTEKSPPNNNEKFKPTTMKRRIFSTRGNNDTETKPSDNKPAEPAKVVESATSTTKPTKRSTTSHVEVSYNEIKVAGSAKFRSTTTKKVSVEQTIVNDSNTTTTASTAACKRKKESILDDDDDEDEKPIRINFKAKMPTDVELNKSSETKSKAPLSASSESKNDETKKPAKRKIFSSNRSNELAKLKTQSFDFNFDFNTTMTNHANEKDNEDRPSNSNSNSGSTSSSICNYEIKKRAINSARSSGELRTARTASAAVDLNECLIMENDVDGDDDSECCNTKLISCEHDKLKSKNIDALNEEFKRVETFEHTNVRMKSTSKLKQMRLFEDNESDDSCSTNTNDNYEADVFDEETVVLFNSRKAYECEELGESQAFMDELFYIMDGLKRDKFTLSQRCLSAIKFAELCLSSEFRMHLRSSHGTLTKIFKLLSDAPLNASLALCTSCIMFALSRDKLVIEMDESTIRLMLAILNSDNTNLTSSTSKDNDLYAKSFKQCKELCNKLLIDSNKSNISSEDDDNKTNQDEDDNDEEDVNDSDSKKNDMTLTNDRDNKELTQFEINLSLLSAQQLSMECLLNLTVNKRASDWLKDELRILGAFDNILESIAACVKALSYSAKSSKLEKLAETITHNVNTHNYDDFYLITKYTRCLNLLENLTQTSKFGSSYSSMLNEASKSETNSTQLNPFYLNHHYLMNYKHTILLDMLNDSLEYFFNELYIISEIFKHEGGAKQSSPEKFKRKDLFNLLNTKRTLITNAIKQTFLLIINLSHANYECTKLIIQNIKLSDLVLVFIHKVVEYINELDRFDILVLALIILVNLLVIKFNMNKMNYSVELEVNSTSRHDTKSKATSRKGQKSKLSPIFLYKQIDMSNFNFTNALNLSTNIIQSLDIILKLYQTKQALLTLAESDQENEFIQLNEQINSQNVENINQTVMNSIHKAGKHMEDHILAAHCAIILTYMLVDSKFQSLKQTSSDQLIDVDELKRHMVDKSFQNMNEIIKKFLSFMKIMKVTGFAADEHIDELVAYLEDS